MNRILFLLLILTLGSAETILIPEDYATIQEGIDASVDGDTVLVADGDYVENLVLDKSIVLTSYAIYDNLDDWIIFDEYYFSRWVINNSHIENTRLIGFSPDDPDYGSVILITPDSEECISPEIVGFTIQGGSGTTILREQEDEEGNPIYVPYTLGGGILADVSDPHIHHNAFENNGSEEVYSGGAAQLTSSAEDWSFDNRFENYNPRCDVEEFRLSDNLYNGNDAQYGNSMANRFHEDEFDMSGSIFDVFDCGNEESAVSTIWVKVEPVASVDYDDGAGQTCAFTAPNVYVDSSIPQECLDEGCGFSNNPFKTIARALEMINPTEDNPITIHLAAGTYSPETGEIFPLIMESNVNIEGEDEETTILDAMETGRVITMEYCDNNTISGITITGGVVGLLHYIEEKGGGISLSNSSPTLTHVTISGNTANDDEGGGMSIFDGYSPISTSSPTLNHVTITNNTAYNGGGIYISVYSNVTLNHVTITNNTAYSGAGMYLHGSNPTLTHVTISGNTANDEGGGMYLYWDANPTLTHVTISNNTAVFDGGGMYLEFSDPTLTHVTISGNMVVIYSGGGMYLEGSNPTLTNSIIWDNSPGSILGFGTPIITFSDIEGGWEGEGNIDADPLFTNPENGDYSLQEGSACIDTGIIIEDMEYYGSAPDMGAYEYICLSNIFDECGVCEGDNSSCTDCNGTLNGSAFIDTCGNCIEGNTDSIGCTNVYVNPNIDNECVGEGCGSENNAYKTISKVFQMLTTLTEDNPITIQLAAGTYSPETGESFPIDMISNVNIEGEDEETTILDAMETSRVITMENCVNNSISGITITGGLAEGDGFDNYGGGMYLYYSNPTLTHVTISGNTADMVAGYGSRAGGMYLGDSNPILTHVNISNNTAYRGGGMFLEGSHPILTHGTISGNTADMVAGYGGGMSIGGYSNPTLTHVTISNNTAYRGGGMSLGSSSPTLTDMTITNNTAQDRGGAMFLSSTYPTLTNSIVWNNSQLFHSIHLWSGAPLVTYSDIEDGWEGEGNIDIDPLFVDPENGDYTLQAGSPCIDAGTADIDGDGTEDITDYAGSAPDMGAYEFCAYFDECGVCGGSGIVEGTCDCDGNILDECGVCGGDGIVEGICDCDGNILDECGVCEGDNSSCTDCNGTLNGSAFIDTCGNCIEGNTDSIGCTNVYVNPNIDNECVGEGCGSENNAYKTISKVFQMLTTLTEDNPITVQLAAGTYSPETGESFPIDMISNVNIEGEDEETSILDAQGTARVITMQGCDNNTISNITITGGLENSGGGMYLTSSNPTLTHVTIIGNTAEDWGGGMYVGSSNPTLTHVTITGNTGYYGGGMYLISDSNPTLTHVTITGNTAVYGGGMYVYNSNPTLTHVTISGNTANDEGGGMYLEGSNPTLTHVTISNNTAVFDGGGMYLEFSDPTLTHVTISGNTVVIYSGGGMYLEGSNPTLTNSIIWDNSPGSILGFGTPIITFSDIEGGWEGEGNIDIDPLFTDSENGDYTLQENSPCIDAGTADIDGDGVDDITNYIGSAPDMGAFEFGESSEIMAGDANFDGIVDILDIVRIINQILGNSEFNDDEFTAADFNADGIVDILDIVQIVNYILP